MVDGRRKISVCILAHNEEDKIAYALESARACSWCDEIIVFDSGSTDATQAIAELTADKVEYHAWIDFSTNRRMIVEVAKNDWVFLLDADEEISVGLRNEIAKLAEAEYVKHPIFTMPRRNFLFGRHVKAWDPDRIDRLFDRTRVKWPDRAVHDTRHPTKGTIGKLQHHILHRRHIDDWGDYFEGERFDKRTDALAMELYEAGKRASWADLWLRAPLTFLKFWLFKGGIWQGTFGMLVARKTAMSVHLKYTRLWHIEQAQLERPNVKVKLRLKVKKELRTGGKLGEDGL